MTDRPLPELSELQQLIAEGGDQLQARTLCEARVGSRRFPVQAISLVGREYIIPTALDPRVLLWESPAVAEMAMKTGVARKTIDIDEYREQLAYRQGKGEQVRYFFQNKARSSGGRKRIVFAEGEEQKVIRAAYHIQEEGIATPVLIGRTRRVEEQLKILGLEYKPEIVDFDTFSKFDQYARAFYELRQRKGVTAIDASSRVRDPNIFGLLMVKEGDSDAFVSGLTYDYLFFSLL